MTGKIRQGGVGLSIDSMYDTHWQEVRDVARGLNRDRRYVRLLVFSFTVV
jgi:hypothetical protein